jgi:oligopeptide transport system substrate-binding protein
MINNYNNFKKLAIVGAISAVTALASVSAIAAKHPITGVELATDQSYTYRLLDGIPTIDPQVVEGVESSVVVRDLFEGLLNQDDLGNNISGVAKSFDISEDKTTYTFHLRKSNWSNGDPVTANDFVYAWRRAVDPKTASPYAWYMEMMAIKNGADVIKKGLDPKELGVEAVDDYTFKVTLEAPLPYFPSMVTHTTTFPTHKATVEKFGKDWTKPENIIGNGAFTLKQWTLKEQLVLERNPSYWNNANTILDKVTALVINDENQALIRFKAGDIDKTEIPAGQYPAMKKSNPTEASSFPALCNYYYTFNLSDSGPKAFKDVRVRKALSYALDRNVIVNNVLKGGQFPAYTFTPAATAGFEVPKVPYAAWTQKERDAKAVELLTAAGYSKDNPLEFDMIYNTDEAHKKVATVISQMWKQKLGVKAVLANQEWKTFLVIRKKQEFELARGAWCGDYNEASTFLDLMTTQAGYNHGKWLNKEVDTLMNGAKTSETPNTNYTRVEQLMAEEMPVIPVYHYTRAYMIKDTLKGWPVDNVQQTIYSRTFYKAAK